MLCTVRSPLPLSELRRLLESQRCYIHDVRTQAEGEYAVIMSDTTYDDLLRKGLDIQGNPHGYWIHEIVTETLDGPEIALVPRAKTPQSSTRSRESFRMYLAA